MYKNLLLAVASFGLLAACTPAQMTAQGQPEYGWYSEGEDNRPEERIRITVTNPLDVPLENHPVVVKREDLPVQNIPERWVNIVDPNRTPRENPTLEELEDFGGYLYREEQNGYNIDQQLDDLDKDGVWDEIFFLVDLEPGETKDFYIYVGFYERGILEHRTHAGIGNYGRMTVPFWESETMGWKLWYKHDVDLHAKVDRRLTAYQEYTTNRSGYYMDWVYGTDIMQVRSSFGAGGMAIFEDPSDPENPSRAYHGPYKDQGPYKDARFSYDVDFNGPLRSRLVVRTMHWNTEMGGFYELEQRYTAVAHKNWSDVEVKFTKFLPPHDNVKFGAGIRKVGITGSEEYEAVIEDGFVISMGHDIEARIPDEDIGDEALEVPWQATALAIKDVYNPEYYSIENYLGNHVFMLDVNEEKTFEYKIFGAWSMAEDDMIDNEGDFVEYVRNETLKYNNPPVVDIHEHEVRPD